MILVIVSPLSRKINSEKVTCWWLCRGTLIFYINLIVGFFFFLLFAFLYTCLLRKLLFLWNAAKVERSLVMQRLVRLLIFRVNGCLKILVRYLRVSILEYSKMTKNGKAWVRNYKKARIYFVKFRETLKWRKAAFITNRSESKTWRNGGFTMLDTLTNNDVQGAYFN